jgi:hypothetical protein
MNVSTGHSSHRTLAGPETLGCHIGTRQDILPDFKYELDKRLVSASMFVRLLLFPLRGMPTGSPVITHKILYMHVRWLYYAVTSCSANTRRPPTLPGGYSLCFCARCVLHFGINIQTLTPSLPDDRRGLVGVVTMPVHCGF